MELGQSELFSPYRFIGVVTGSVAPSVRSVFVGKKSTCSVLCPIDNVILQYNGSNLRPIGSSDPVVGKITAVASSSSCVFAAHNKTISALPFCRNITDSIDVPEDVKMMELIGEQIVAVDTKSEIHVIGTSPDLHPILTIENGENFQISAIIHPSTYLNKIVIGSTTGLLRVVNFKTGKIIHEFEDCFESAVTFLAQTTALDILAIGLESGKILLYNLKLGSVLHMFQHDSRITCITFRDDGEPTMVTADCHGSLAVWDLETRELIGKITDVHSDTINRLHFIPGEPIMISASHDNSLRVWIFDSADSMPRELVRLDGHSLDATNVRFINKNHLLSAGLDGSVRKYDVTSLSMRNNMGKSAIEKTKSKNPSDEGHGVLEIVAGWQREANWNNVFCRHKNTTKITTWQTRNNTSGDFVINHDRFSNNAKFVDANASALCLSSCGNFVFVGYSTGHIDQFNTQSGRLIHSYTHSHKKSQKKSKTPRRAPRQDSNDTPIIPSKITSLTVDQRGQELMSTDENGFVTFWNLSTRQITAKLFKKNSKLGMSSKCPTNSLVAVVSILENGKESVVLIDSVCHKIVREFEKVGKSVNALTFSADGRWLLVADNEAYIRVYDVPTAHMIDIVMLSKPCISMSFNETGEFLATIHKEERAVYVWANKAVFLPYVNIRALDPDFLPTRATSNDGPQVCIDDDEDSIIDEEIRAMRELQIDSTSITFSGLPLSRWANLPDFAKIKERNKAVLSVKKIKQAPFFLSAIPTLEGFDFQSDDLQLDPALSDKLISDKRNMLELESSFTSLLKSTKCEEDLVNAFRTLQSMTLSAIDFQIRSLDLESVSLLLRMLLVVLKSRKQFELVEAYLLVTLKLHRILTRSIITTATLQLI
uniref:WD_REPEATS_REGION domain-containing protein n=1 Tax=Caenorhabditis japonica TaxID=281687 RepID=A0A8R1HTU6_CAEJA